MNESGAHVGGSVDRAPALTGGDPGSNPGPGENFFSLTNIYDL